MFRRNFLQTMGMTITSFSLPSLFSFSFKKPSVFEIIRFKNKKYVSSSIGKINIFYFTEGEMYGEWLSDYSLVSWKNNNGSFAKFREKYSNLSEESYKRLPKSCKRLLYDIVLNNIERCDNIKEFVGYSSISGINTNLIYNPLHPCLSINNFDNFHNIALIDEGTKQIHAFSVIKKKSFSMVDSIIKHEELKKGRRNV